MQNRGEAGETEPEEPENPEPGDQGDMPETPGNSRNGWTVAGRREVFPTIPWPGQRKKSAAEMGSRWNRRRKKTDLQEVMSAAWWETRRQKSLQF